MIKLLTFFMVLVAFYSNVYGVEEVQVKEPQKIKLSSESKEIEPLSSSMRKRGGDEEVFTSFLDLRQKKRMGIGAEIMGKSGIMGLQAELNLTPDNSAFGFVGGGQGFNSFGFGWKSYFGEKKLAPYFSISVSRWYNASEGKKNVSASTPSYLSHSLLNSTERDSGKYTLNMVTPSLGIQYFFLEGEMQNSSILAEIILLKPVDRSAQVVTAGLGYNFTF